MGNNDFERAEDTLKKAVEDMQMKEVEIFMEKFLPSYNMTLDEINK